MFSFLLKLALFDIASVLWSSLVVKILWGWFAVAELHLPVLSYPAIVGAVIILSVATHHYTKTDIDDLPAMILDSAFTPGYLLAIGFIVHLFI
jgi:hypothetical protein